MLLGSTFTWLLGNVFKITFMILNPSKLLYLNVLAAFLCLGKFNLSMLVLLQGETNHIHSNNFFIVSISQASKLKKKRVIYISSYYFKL